MALWRAGSPLLFRLVPRFRLPSNATFHTTLHTGGMTVRLDYRFNDKHSLYARYLHENFTWSMFGPLWTAEFYDNRHSSARPGYGIQLVTTAHYATLVTKPRLTPSWNAIESPAVSTGRGHLRLAAAPTVFPGGRFPDGIPDIIVASGGACPSSQVRNVPTSRCDRRRIYRSGVRLTCKKGSQTSDGSLVVRTVRP